MFNELSPGIKISISRSISTVFEQYMEKIQWDENKYSLEDFIHEWKEYINNHASWFDQVSDEIKEDPSFHEDLALKINETIEKILSEEPTPDQLEQIEQLQKELKTDYSYSCKAEAKFLIQYLSKQ
ncbi:hypothetical protein [Bacillus sp. FJAT-49736]|uniref:hypothetical protein n=1 Tax=Bacillus sp. FJAT-49736 TaxID=2833582 RepID=UPI001BC9E6A0|nr:hypothetical protein [Bacillus sp. FJAT-49736]MBS4175445.1 hypothetical protein [Bacillus sp. FJAT-49736]